MLALDGVASRPTHDGVSSEPVAKKRILFVDDEPAILAGLQRVLYKERRRWELVFVAGGEQALAEVERGAFDVVVTDMRMPGMNGGELLARIRELHPATVRIMLTGHADRDTILHALPAVHQLLAKPCDVDTLRVALERSLAVASLACAAPLKALLGRIACLPARPERSAALQRALAAPATSAAQLEAAVAGDAAICAKLLQLANSGYFSAGKATTSPRDAIALLGVDQLRELAEAGCFAPVDLPAFAAGALACSDSSPTCGRDVRRLRGAAGEDDTSLRALVGDVGRLVLALGMPDRYPDVLARAAAGGVHLCLAERAAFAVDHAEVGAALLALWGVPLGLVEPEQGLGGRADQAASAVTRS